MQGRRNRHKPYFICKIWCYDRGGKYASKAVLIAAVPPILLQGEDNPEGLPIEAFDGFRAGLMADRAQFYKDLAILFYGADLADAQVSPGILQQFWFWSMQSGIKNANESVKAFSATDSTKVLWR